MTILQAVEAGSSALGWMGAALGAGVVAIGAGMGIGRLAGSAAEGMARQPEAANDIRGLAVLTAVFIEGVALFGEVICLLVALKA